MASFRYSVTVSVDGYIADKNGDIGWQAHYASSDLGLDTFLASADFVILGRTTYDLIKTSGSWPYLGKRGYVLTTRPIDGPVPPGVEAVNGVAAVIERLKSRTGQAWVVGGGITARAFFDAGALDELELYVVPTLLGQGVPLFARGADSRSLILTESEAYRNGVVRMFYTV
jgi:dihydrofolate reductase